jgi:hypothetical protein
MVTIERCTMSWLANESVRARFGIACTQEFGENAEHTAELPAQVSGGKYHEIFPLKTNHNNETKEPL